MKIQKMQSQLHRLNRRCTINASDGYRIDRCPSIGASFGAWWDQVNTTLRHRFNRRVNDRHRSIQRTIIQRRCVLPYHTAPQPSLQHRKNRCPIGVMHRSNDVSKKRRVQRLLCHRFNRRPSIGLTDGPRFVLQLCQRSQRLLQSAV